MSSISLTTSPPLHFHHHHLHVYHHHPHSSSMTMLRGLNLRRLLKPQQQQQQRRRYTSISAAVRQDTTIWTEAPVSEIQPAAESLFHVSIDVSDSPYLLSSYTRPGQYLQLRLPDVDKPSFLAIASPPSLSNSKGVFQFLVKSVSGSTAELLCRLTKGDLVQLTQASGKGFDTHQISPPEQFPTVLIFATGSGISPVRSLIESGFSASKRADVRLYYGARNLDRMAYQVRFKHWESTGVQIVPVLSQPHHSWDGERGYVQNAFARSQHRFNPLATGVVLCGQRQMTEEVTSVLVADGVPREKILKNF